MSQEIRMRKENRNQEEIKTPYYTRFKSSFPPSLLGRGTCPKKKKEQEGNKIISSISQNQVKPSTALRIFFLSFWLGFVFPSSHSCSFSLSMFRRLFCKKEQKPQVFRYSKRREARSEARIELIETTRVVSLRSRFV